LGPALLAWFSAHARALPWRRTLDPYAIWVSEIMLQQTQVTTVIPYWERWLSELPTIRALAEAEPDRVMKLWEGLGYYSRARHLQTAARLLVREHGGTFPTAFDEILRLPGIGRYTAGAIASIAFNQPRPILDGNVIRVLTRLYGIKENPRGRLTSEQLWGLALDLVTVAGASAQARSGATTASPPQVAIPPSSAVAKRTELQFAGACSRLNQALMELGATVCTPRQPQCAGCPVRRSCVAHATGQVSMLPNLGPRPSSTSRRFIAFVLEHRKRWLVRRRPAGSVNAGLWEFPNVEVSGKKPANDATLARLAAQVTGRTAMQLQPLLSVRHSITRYRIQLDAYRGSSRPGPAKPARPSPDACWLPMRELEKLAFASAHRKLLTCLRDPRRSR
jgi:A/G-specific adenine glycosylase